ncbi:MAG: gephyrin-like molybdotransferase Glp [Thermacetogeniaceae bacterium]
MGIELFTVLPVPEARSQLAALLPLELRQSEPVPLLRCLGRRLAQIVRSRENVPGFARSTVDGYAVRAADTFGAGEGAPAYFTVTGEVLMGFRPEQGIALGEAMRISTGGMLPPGSNAVLMVEHTEMIGPEGIEAYRPVGPGENVIYADEDMRAGDEVLPANHLLRPQDIGYLAAMGELELEVFSPLRVGIVSTGDEIVPVSARPAPGQVRDVNSYSLYSQAQQWGGEPVLYGVVRDDPGLLALKLQQAYEETDLVLVSGGSSVGTRDHAAEIITNMGEPGLVFHGLAVRPGKPTLGGVVGRKPIFGLPGHPAAALIAFDLMVAPLLKFGGYNQIQPGALRVRALVSRSLASAPGREEYFRVRLRRQQGALWADPLLGKSGLLKPMVEADGLIKVPLESEGIAAGAEVDVVLFGTDYVL